MSAAATPPPSNNPANRLHLNYRDVPPRKIAVPLIDVHTHVYNHPNAAAFFEAADLYGIDHIVSMSPLADVAPLRDRWGDRLSFIAIPNWREMKGEESFRAQWLRDLAAFREHGARLCKFWMAPPMRDRGGLTLDHAFMRPVIDAARDLGFDFMVHIADPSAWFAPGARYADSARYGTKHDQYHQLRWFLDYVGDRFVIGAHLGGNSEDPAFLDDLLTTYPNYYLDSSATKWIVREVSRHPTAIHDLLARHADRVLFGSDLVASEKYAGFDHYASRYSAHLMLWETDRRGESPIDDPDADDPPQLNGVDLPADVLQKLYRDNARRLGIVR